MTTLEITLSGRLETLAAGNAVNELASQVETDVGELAEDVGLSGRVQVGVSASPAGRPLRVLVNGVSAPCPPDLLWQLWMEHPAGLPEVHNGSGHSIAEDCLAAHCGANECGPADIARLVVSMIRDRPALLVDAAQAASFAAEAGGSAVDSSALEAMLRSLLDLGVAPYPQAIVVETLASHGNRVEDSVEAAFARLQGRRVEIGVSARYRVSLTGNGSSEPALVTQSAMDPISGELFDLLEQRLLVEWGLIPPDLVWTTAHDLPDRSIVVKVNDRYSAPCRGLDEGDQVLLLDKVGDFPSSQGAGKRRLLNPANAALELVVVDSAAADDLDGSIASAPPAGFAALVLYRELVTNAHRLISTEQTLYLLRDLERRAPELVHLVLRHFTVAEVTQLIRALVRERIPPRLLPVILERLVHLVMRPLPPKARPEFVRRGLSDYLSHRFLGELGRTFFDLSPELEGGLAAAASDDLYAERVRDAVWSALRATRIPPVRAALLVRRAPRDVLYELLAPELPEVVVIRASELGPDVPEPTARVALAEPGRGLVSEQKT
jgi:hypothetical protein